jgi:hypothetical protein
LIANIAVYRKWRYAGGKISKERKELNKGNKKGSNKSA